MRWAIPTAETPPPRNSSRATSIGTTSLAEAAVAVPVPIVGLTLLPAVALHRLRQVPVGYLFDVMSNGFAAMADYSAQVPVRDRWAIIAYVRTLQAAKEAATAAQ